MNANKKNFEKIEQKLLERKRELEEMLNVLNKEKLTDDQVQDLGDQVSSSTSETLRTSLENSEMQEYQRVLNALQSIKDGTYGICIDCGMPISEKRLQYFPDALRCIPCQEALER